MIVFVLFLFTLATASTNWNIYCGFYFEAEPKVNVWACHPSSLSIVANDTVTFTQLRSTSMPVFTKTYLPILIDTHFKDAAVQPHCVLATPNNCGVCDFTAIPPVCTEMCITDPNQIYTAGPLNDHLPITDFYTVRNPFAQKPGGPTWTARFPVPGEFPWFSCIDSMQGQISVVPASEAANIPTLAEVTQATNDYHATLPGLMQKFMDDNQVGSAYTAAPSFENAEGFTTWVLRAGWQDATTNITFSGFAPPNISITQGDTIAFQFQMYAGEDPYDLPAVHTVYFNASVNDPDWSPFYTFGGGVTVPFGPSISYFPWFERFTFLGFWESSQGSIDGFGNPKQFSDGLLSSGFRLGMSKELEDPSNHYSVTFTAAGRFPYICYLHLGMGMTGEITVTPREIADRTDSQVDASLSNLDVNLMKSYSLAYLELQNGFFMMRKVSYVVSTATHGISELVFGDNNFMLQIKITAVFRTPSKQSAAAQQSILDEVSASFTNFFADYTYTPHKAWSAVAVASPYVNPNSENTTDVFFSGNIIVFHSDSQILQSSLLLFASLIMFFLF